MQTGTVECEQGAEQGIDWTSHIEFSVDEMPQRVQRAEELLIEQGYAVSYGTRNDEFLANGPGDEILALKNGTLAMFTGCIVG